MTCLGLPRTPISDISGLYGMYYNRLPAVAVQVGEEAEGVGHALSSWSGGRNPTTPWGQPTRGYKTRNNKSTDRFIIKRREKK